MPFELKLEKCIGQVMVVIEGIMYISNVKSLLLSFIADKQNIWNWNF